ncbi:EscU/YscU/HrcU family type III secretion system export apparatus switch protein, partial [Vagococcus salmoninarum]
MKSLADKDGKTEKPSPKRLRESRQKGELTKSPELSSAITFAIFS